MYGHGKEERSDVPIKKGAVGRKRNETK